MESELIDGRAVTVEAWEPDGAPGVFEGYVERARGERVSLSLGRRRGASLDGLAPGAPVRVRYFDAQGMYVFDSRVVQARDGDRIRLLLAAPAEISRIQRRRFLRLALRLPMLLQRLDERGRPREECAATTIEVGGNGLGFVARHGFAVGERVRAMFELEGWGRCTGVGQIKRSVLAMSAGGTEHRVALQFTEVDGKSQALILSYLLALQRARRQRS
jgi:c-di-GMP-binding flagellar brake protein YcgR